MLKNQGNIELTNALMLKDGNFINDSQFLLSNACVQLTDGNFKNNGTVSGLGSIKTEDGNINNSGTWDANVIYFYSGSGSGLPGSPSTEAEVADGLKEGGADVLWLETISAAEEYRAAAEGFGLAGMDWCGTMSFDTAGRTMMGMTSADMVKMVEGLPNPPLGFGANCGTGASDLLRTVLGFRAQGTERPIIAKGNAGIPKYVDGHIHYDGTPDLMADYAIMARDCGATIIGGCCGTMPDHLRHMRDALDSRPRAEPPTLDAITEALGAFSSASDGTGDNEPTARITRRKRARA